MMEQESDGGGVSVATEKAGSATSHTSSGTKQKGGVRWFAGFVQNGGCCAPLEVVEEAREEGDVNEVEVEAAERQGAEEREGAPVEEEHASLVVTDDEGPRASTMLGNLSRGFDSLICKNDDNMTVYSIETTKAGSDESDEKNEEASSKTMFPSFNLFACQQQMDAEKQQAEAEAKRIEEAKAKAEAERVEFEKEQTRKAKEAEARAKVEQEILAAELARKTKEAEAKAEAERQKFDVVKSIKTKFAEKQIEMTKDRTKREAEKKEAKAAAKLAKEQEKLAKDVEQQEKKTTTAEAKATELKEKLAAVKKKVEESKGGAEKTKTMAAMEQKAKQAEETARKERKKLEGLTAAQLSRAEANEKKKQEQLAREQEKLAKSEAKRKAKAEAEAEKVQEKLAKEQEKLAKDQARQMAKAHGDAKKEQERLAKKQAAAAAVSDEQARKDREELMRAQAMEAAAVEADAEGDDDASVTSALSRLSTLRPSKLLGKNKVDAAGNERNDAESQLGETVYDHFQVVIAKEATDVTIRVPASPDLTFADLRKEMEEDVDSLPWKQFKMCVKAGGSGIYKRQEKKWKVRDYLAKGGDGSYKHPYRVYIKEAKKLW